MPALIATIREPQDRIEFVSMSPIFEMVEPEVTVAIADSYRPVTWGSSSLRAVPALIATLANLQDGIEHVNILYL